MKALALAFAALSLAACTTPSGLKPPQIVHVPVPVSCVAKDFPTAPAYTDTLDALQKAPDFAARYALLAGNWDLRDSRLKALEAQVAACR